MKGIGILTFALAGVLGLTACIPSDTDNSAPSAPGNLTASASSSNTIALSWTAAQTPANGGGVTAYRLERKTGVGAFALVATPKFNATSYSDAGLTAGTAYTYRLKAQNAFGFGPYSSESSASTNP